MTGGSIYYKYYRDQKNHKINIYEIALDVALRKAKPRGI
jgi:hypothetical protein